MASKSSIGLLAGVAAVGAGLYFMSTRASAATKPPAPSSPLAQEMSRLMQQDQGLASAISQALATITAPDQLNRLQQAVQFSYPNLGVALGKRLADSTMPLAVGITPQPIAWLDPQGALHVYTSDFTPILVMKAPFDANGVPQMVDRNPSSGFDTLVKNLATGSIGWKSIFDALQAKLYAPK